MAEPTRYELSYDFTSFQEGEPSSPLPADKLEIELNNIDRTTDEIIDNLGLIQKSDGTLANGIVAAENLATELTIGLNSPTSWVNSTAYVVNDTVITDNNLYRCIVAHTSGVFATDLAASKWELIADYSAFVTAAEAAQTAAEAAQTAAEAAQTAAEAAYDDLDDRYLGPKSSDPSLDNDGDALVTGALYFNTSDNQMLVYNGSSWVSTTGVTSFPVFVYTATGGETSVSGADDNANTLTYTAGKLLVFLNGEEVTQDVTATNGTSITGFSAMSAADVVVVYTFEAVQVLEDISSHSVATPATNDYLLFQDVNASNADRRATIDTVVKVVYPTALANVVEDTSPQLGGALDTNGKIVQFSKGSDVASANSLSVGATGNYFDVTGTTNITSIATSGRIGTVIKLHFDASLTISHHATDLILPGGDDIVTAAGDEAEFIEYASGDWRCTNYSKADGTAVVGSIDGVAKAWADIDMTGTATLDNSFNVSGIVDDGTGLVTVTWDVDFANANYVCAGMTSAASAGNDESVVTLIPGGRAVGSAQFQIVDVHNDANNIDTDPVMIVAFGDQ